VTEIDPEASRDGRWIAYVVDQPSISHRRFSELWKMSVDGRRRIRLLRSRSLIRYPNWSGNGRTIYFAYYVDHTRWAECGAIFRVGSNGLGLRRLTRAAPRSHWGPSVSPDGRRVAFIDESGCEGGTTRQTVRVVDASGRPIREKFAQCIKWSPDSRKLACPDWDGLFVVNRDGSGRRRLTPRPLHVGDPMWSPDGRWIAFVRTRRTKIRPYDEYVDAVYRVDPRGKRLRRLTRGAAYPNEPGSLSWLPRVPS